MSDQLCGVTHPFMDYKSLYDKSIGDPQQFWTDIAKDIYWKKPPNNVLVANFDIRKGPIFTKFMSGALTNVCYNVLDIHIERGVGDRIACYFEGNDGKIKRCITYSDLRRDVCKFANGIKGLGIKKGDRIAIYMPVSIECVVAMLACARIGAVHVVIVSLKQFAGFSAKAVAARIIDSGCVLLVSSDCCYRAKKLIPLKEITDSALDICIQRGYQKISNVVNKHLSISSEKTNCNSVGFHWNEHVDIWWHHLIENANDFCEPVWVNAEDPLFILYTSGSTGKPKGILHTTGGYLLHNYLNVKHMFHIRDGDIFFCSSDIGWSSAHNFGLYGVLVHSGSTVLMEGSPTYPRPDRIYEIIDRLKVNHFYGATTLIRILMNLGDHFTNKYNRSSLRCLGFGGEPISSEAWLWLWRVVGENRCFLNNIYGQTENGVNTFCSMTAILLNKPCSIGLPMFGISAAILDHNGNEIEGPGEGHLVYKKPWPSMSRTIVSNHELYEKTYFHRFPGYYWTSDWVRRDNDGYYWVNGRVDDTLKISGRLLSIMEIETAVNEHSSVAEAAVVSVPHKIMGDIPSVFLVLNKSYELTSELESDIKMQVREKIGRFVQLDKIIAISGLPKTRTGKVMRRILNKIIRNESDLGDTSTLEDHSILKELQKFIKLAS